jgi:glycosyltransferase involved in cell wall biosynthesis
VFRFLESRALKGSYSRIICLTHRSEQVLAAEGIAADRLMYVPHAVDVTRFHSGVAPELRRQLKLSSESLVVGYAGALTREKGFDQLLDAMKQLKGDNDVILLVAGEESAKDKWQEVADELTEVYFLGRLEHQSMPGFMTSLDLFVIPSLTETLPTTLLEALATGTPVMATPVGGISEFLQDEWGILLESPESSSIVSAVEEWRLRRRELEKMGKRGQRYVREHHNWERTGQLTERVYQSCLAK